LRNEVRFDPIPVFIKVLKSIFPFKKAIYSLKKAIFLLKKTIKFASQVSFLILIYRLLTYFGIG